ncbi:D-serine deaminase-like pyridoxal phosphate-dependent protein [Xanthomonas sacchari]|uniref:D-TA family PLP-dependent enzyme n=1 Tax=Xanthomonas sacchari TaxID=56458 RepID=UPI00278B13A5|nr:D-TA family PLP-dependent enzyme [Xanthomonas sacchari]MDQ1094179.1 D-serine deaminase-like pyridoxal phosphate-dependent protein [Xanthomonas sacchari]
MNRSEETLDRLETPCVLIDVDRVRANLARAQDYADRHGLKLRPHIKTHKLPLFAQWQLQLGAVGITCQKLGEAEVMADAGITDILLSYNVLGAAKLQRLRRLAARVRLKTVADSVPVVDGYAAIFAGAPAPLPVMVECDTGGKRCGVQDPAAALALARHIAAQPGLTFAGLMTYPAAGADAGAHAAQWLREAVGLLERAGLPPPDVSSGGTPDVWSAHCGGVLSEYRPGTYIYLDRYQVARGVGTLEDCALSVLTTVVSIPVPERVIVDAGSKALTSDLLGMDGYGCVDGYPDARIAALSEEHGILDFSACARRPALGETLRIYPNHACPVSNLFDEVQLISGGRWLSSVAVAARGRVD